MRAAGLSSPGRHRHAGRQRQQRLEGAVGERQVGDRFGGDRERSFAAGGLYERRLGEDGQHFSRAADFDRDVAEGHDRPGADRDAGAPQRPERRHLDLDGVGIGRDVREDEVALGVGDDRRGAGVPRLR